MPPPFAHQPSRRQVFAMLLYCFQHRHCTPKGASTVPKTGVRHVAILLPTPVLHTQRRSSSAGQPVRKERATTEGLWMERINGCQPGAPPRGRAVLISPEKLQSVPDTMEDLALHVAVCHPGELVLRVASYSLRCPADAKERVVFRRDNPAAGHSLLKVFARVVCEVLPAEKMRPCNLRMKCFS